MIQLYRTPGVNYSMEHVFEVVNKGITPVYRITKRSLPCAFVRPCGLIRNLWFVFRHCRQATHIVGQVHYAALAMRCKTIITVHDLSYIHFNRGWKRFLFYWFWYALPLRKAVCITCISHKVEKDLVNLFPFVKSKLRVIYNPLDERFAYVPKPFHTLRPVILHIGTAPNKNLARVIHALKGLNCELRIVGKQETVYKDLLEKSGLRYTYRSDLTDIEMVEEYVKADIVSFPSLYEGFGMPIIEGQAVGRPVLTSDNEPLREIAGKDSACFVDPLDVDSIRRGFVRLIGEESFRKALVRQGIENCRRFSKEDIACQYIQLYDTVAGI